MIVVGVEGQGKLALARLALFGCQYDCSEIPISEEFDREVWTNLLQKMIISGAVNKRFNVLNMQDNQMGHDFILVELNTLMKNGTVPDLLTSLSEDSMNRTIQG